MDPLVGSERPRDSGVISVTAADGVTSYATRIAPAIERVQWKFRDLTDTDRANLENFCETVLGAWFKLLDPLTASSYVTAKFAPEILRHRSWQTLPRTTSRWGVVIEFLVLL
jgi:hypothetical protein